jgi:hypothetical protein
LKISFVCMGKKKGGGGGEVRGDKVFFKSKLKSAVEELIGMPPAPIRQQPTRFV